jgi:hypothetical protein
VNQAIQFIDRVEFDEQKQRLTFYAQVSGLIVECHINTNSLMLEDATMAKEYFETLRFDYEDLAEQLIDDEEYNSAGQIEITALS